MSQSDDPSGAPRRLPLTDAVGTDAPGPMIDEAMIRALVDTFYGTIREDELLGPVFARHVADWSMHLPKMYAFWSAVVLRTGRYSGRPLEAHRRLPGLTQAHFDRWVALWTQSVASVVPMASRDAFVLPARRMAASMSSVLLDGG